MAYLAIARKWRPHRFDDLVGQGHVVQTLKNAILLNRVSHAYLFSGSRGIGKTSVARIFAKALRCPNAKDALPCNTCPECQAVAESRSVDVVEIDGASNNGVEAVRGIRENVAYGASSGYYKIYIIDEVHMLSLSAFNALLKTLEEPPPHVVFIFATTEVQKIPLTIVSRCQRFEFRRLTNTQVVTRLHEILAAEKVSVSEEGLRVIAAHSDGSLRDALSLLDQVLSFYGSAAAQNALSEAQIVEALGVTNAHSVRLFMKAVIQKNIPELLKVITEVYFSGVDLKHFSERCLETSRLLYLAALSRQERETLTADSLDISPAQWSELNSWAAEVSLLQVERMAQILSRTIEQLSWCALPRFVVEMAAVRMCKLDVLDKIENALFALSPKASAGLASTTEPDSRPQTIAEAATTEVEPPAAKGLRERENPLVTSDADPQTVWKAFVEAVMKKRPLLGALLSHANFMVSKEGAARKITLAFAPGSFYERQATDSRNRAEIEEQLKQFFGRETAFALGNELQATMKSLEETKSAEEAAIRKSALEHPEVQKMKRILGAEIVDVHVE